MHKVMSFAIVIFLSGQALATDPVSSATNKTSPTKMERRKKATMCPTCGKPESRCDCPGEKKDEHVEHDKHSKASLPEKK